MVSWPSAPLQTGTLKPTVVSFFLHTRYVKSIVGDSRQFTLLPLNDYLRRDAGFPRNRDSLLVRNQFTKQLDTEAVKKLGQAPSRLLIF
jgi:hypothetical protein